MGRKRKLKVTTEGQGPTPSKSYERGPDQDLESQEGKMEDTNPGRHPIMTRSRAIRGNVGDSSTPTTVSGVDAEATGLGLELHPLLNDVVLRNMFKYFSGNLELLCNCRLVCKVWRDASLPTWTSIASPRITFSEEGRSYFLTDLDGESTSLDEFLEGEGRTVPYRQFYLKRWTFHERDGVDATADRFWGVVGRHLTKLTLEHCTSAKPETFYRLINQVCPNLDTLVLDKCELCDRDIWDKKVEEDEAEYKEPTYGAHLNLKSLQLIYDDLLASDYLRVTYLELLSHFPYLTSFRMDSNRIRNEMLKFLGAVKIIRMEVPGALPIPQLATGDPVHFDFGGREHERDPNRRDNLLDLLQELGIRLQSILLSHLNPTVHELQTIVQFTGPALNTLVTLDEPHCDFPFGVELSNLQDLSMPEGFCDNFEFIKFTPNLRNLRIWNSTKNDTMRREFETTLICNASEFELASTRLWKLTSLKLEDFSVSDDDLRCLVRWMPCVKILTMVLTNTQFRIVCENWQSLVYLQVDWNRLTDEGVIGSQVQLQSQQSTRGIVEQEEAQVGGLPISLLQKLHTFKAPQSKLTDASILLGLLKLERLRQIFLRHEIGDEAKEALDRRRIIVSEFDIPEL